jgi:hypothetical protein
MIHVLIIIDQVDINCHNLNYKMTTYDISTAGINGMINPDVPLWEEAQGFKFKFFMIRKCKYKDLMNYKNIDTETMCITESPDLKSLKGLHPAIQRVIVSYVKITNCDGIPTGCKFLRLDNVEYDSPYGLHNLQHVQKLELWSHGCEHYKFMTKLQSMHTLHLWDVDYKPANDTFLQLQHLRSLTMKGVPPVSHEILRGMNLSEAVVDDIKIIGTTVSGVRG